MNSFVKSDNDKGQKTLQKGHLKGIKQIEAISKYRESVLKKKRKIEHLYQQSISNQIYIFPRGKSIASISSQTDSEGLNTTKDTFTYDLKTQNKKDKNYQTASEVMVRCSSVASAEAERVNSKRKDITESFRHLRISNETKGEVNLSNYQSKTKKEKNQQKTATNSGKKLFYLPSNATNRGNLKKPSETIIVSFRGKQGQKSKHNKTQLY